MNIELSCKAIYLLRQAAADPQGKIEYHRVGALIFITANGEDIIEEYMLRENIPHSRRSAVETEWHSALRTLAHAGLLERISNIHFRITENGYEYTRQTSSSP